MRVYLDNAATTAPYPEVFEAMKPYFTEVYGNPSSTHAIGRKARVAIEQARRSIAGHIGASANEIIFTSGGTEADNIFLQGMAPAVGHIISSPLEHPAVLQTIAALAKSNLADVSWLDLEKNGQISIDSLKKELSSHPASLVALMHGNNEVGNLLPLEEVSILCKENNAHFFTDAVQTIGHYAFDLHTMNVTGLAASAHKFHGPKGVGFLYLKQGIKLSSVYKGGEQERGLSIGTENVAGIIGMSKALEICHSRMNKQQQHISLLKKTMMQLLQDSIPGIIFNGTSANLDKSINTVLSVSFAEHDENEMLLFNLDLANISVSAGSACASGATKESHVLGALGHDKRRATVRFSFSESNTVEELIHVVDKLREIFV